MADEPGHVLEDLEHHDPNAPPQTIRETPPAKEDDSDLESQAVDHGGQRMVPLGEVSKLRERRRSDKAQLDQLTQQNQEWVTFGEKLRPIMDRINKDPRLLEAIRTGKIPPATTTPEDEADPDLTEYAKTLDLYTASGEPDIGRAKTLRALHEKQVHAAVEEQVGPIKETTAQGRSYGNFQRMLNLQTPTGKRVDPETLKVVWNMVNAEDSQNNEVANLLFLVASGYQSHFVGGPDQPTVAPQGYDPIISEAAGGAGTEVRLNKWQTKIAQELGTTPTDFAKGIKEVDDRDGVLE
jgi:hypothetical protein